MPTYRVITSHQASYTYALVVQPGEILDVKERETPWPGWLWCTNQSGVSAWLPQVYLERSGDQARALRRYSSLELSVTSGEILTGDEIVADWVWCSKEDGQQGWVPLENLETASPQNYDHLAADYARHRQVHPGVLKDLLETGQVKVDSQVLEVGCGTGNYIIAIQNASNCQARGFDPSAQMLAKASPRSSAVRFSQASAESFDFSPENFDLIFSVDVIHHVQNRPAYFQRAWNQLKSGGQICTVTDSEWIIRHREPLSVYFPETIDVELARYPRIEDLKTMLSETGFSQIQEKMVEFRGQLVDIQPYRDRAYSSLHLISDQAFSTGLARMENDLQSGPIVWAPRYTMLWAKK
jgi:SAM-dependent methyltransferase